MKVIAALMTLTGAVLSTGALLEFAYFGPDTPQFWAGVLAAPAGALFAIAGGVHWRRGLSARRLVRTAAILMIAATACATALDVMGPPATLIGILAPVAAVIATWRRPASPSKIAA